LLLDRLSRNEAARVKLNYARIGDWRARNDE
jgi:hypothetical protein